MALEEEYEIITSYRRRQPAKHKVTYKERKILWHMSHDCIDDQIDTQVYIIECVIIAWHRVTIQEKRFTQHAPRPGSIRAETLSICMYMCVCV